MTISYSKDFLKAVKLLNNAQTLKLKQRIQLYLESPRAPELRNHKLSGRWADFSSINISGDLRVVFQQMEDEVYFVALGTHAKLYK